MKEILAKYLPENAVTPCFELIKANKIIEIYAPFVWLSKLQHFLKLKEGVNRGGEKSCLKKNIRNKVLGCAQRFVVASCARAAKGF